MLKKNEIKKKVHLIRVILLEVMDYGKKPFSGARAVQQWRGGLAAGGHGSTGQ